MNRVFRQIFCLMICTTLIIVLHSPHVFSKKSMRFRRFTIEDGLSQSTVETVVQDPSGMIWIGTEDGLNRFDGTDFTIFRNDIDDPNSLSDNNIWCMYVDRSGFLWIGTYSAGLNRFDPETETFHRYLHDPGDPKSISSDRIRSITEDRAGIIWVGTRDGGMNRMDPGNGPITRFSHDPDSANSLPSDNIRFVLPEDDRTIWIASNRGFSRFEPETGRFTHYRAGTPGSSSLIHDNVRHILSDRAGLLWISTSGGLSSFDPRSREFENYLHDEEDPGSISSSNIRRVFEDRRGRLFIATNSAGLALLDRENNTFTTYRHDPADPRSVSHNSVRVIYEDKGGLLWLGTFGGGLNIHDPGTDRFRHYRHDPSDPNSLSDRIIWSIDQGPEGDIWFGTNSAGLNLYKRRTGEFSVHSKIPEKRQDGRIGYIRNVLWDDDDRLWLTSSHDGIYRFDPSDDSIFRILHDSSDPNSIGNNDIRHIYRDSDGDMWFCLTSNGLDHYDPDRGTFTHFAHDPDDNHSISHDFTTSLFQDSRGIFWLATRNGLNRIEFLKDSTKASISGITRFYHEPGNQESLSNSYVISMHEARDGDLWFGTMQGLSRLRKEDREKPVFSRYLIKNGLPNDVIYGILEDERGNLWLSTNYGISCFDPETEEFKNYNTSDGLHGNEFNTGTFCRTREGTFIFGGVDGATEFHPDSLRNSTFNAPVVLTGFNIFDKPAELERPISGTGEITLSHRDNYFSFEFASLDYSKPDRNQYSYILEGLDHEWTNAGNRRFAGYTRIPAGKYIFRVKGTNGDGVWSDQVASVRITITPPFWKTWWFITLVILAAAGSIAGVITYRVRQLLAIERLRSKIAADLHDDIGAGLTEISIMGEVITRKLPPDSKPIVTSEIERIETTSRHLIDSMSDIVWLVNPHRDSLYDLISRLGDSYKETLHACNITFRTQNLESLKNVRLNMEYRQNLFLIFKEAINNSLKYSKASGISLNVELSGRKLVMRIIDDGKGFDPDQARDGNGLRNMKERAGKIKGMLTIDSTPGKRTTIEFKGNIS